MAKVPAVHREARFSGIRVAVSMEKSVLPDTHTSPQGKCERLHQLDRQLEYQTQTRDRQQSNQPTIDDRAV